MAAESVTVSRTSRSTVRTSTVVGFAAIGVGWYFYDRSVHRLWYWSLLYPGFAVILLIVAYVVSHTSLTYSSTTLTKRLAGRERRLDLAQLSAAGVVVSARRGPSNAVSAIYLEDRLGTRMTLSVIQPYPNAAQWAGYVRAALEGSDAVIGDRVMSTLDALSPRR